MRWLGVRGRKGRRALVSAQRASPEGTRAAGAAPARLVNAQRVDHQTREIPNPRRRVRTAAWRAGPPTTSDKQAVGTRLTSRDNARNIPSVTRLLPGALIVLAMFSPLLVHGSTVGKLEQRGALHSVNVQTLSWTPDANEAKPQIHILVAPSPSNQAPAGSVDWASPATWAQVATALGIVTAGGTLFVGWNNRRRTGREEKRKQQLEWALLAIETTVALDYDLRVDADQGYSASSARYSRDSLDQLTRQVQAASAAFIKLSDPGNEAAWTEVLGRLNNLSDELRKLTIDYTSISRYLEEREVRPGDPDLSNLLRRVISSASYKEHTIRERLLPELRKSIGKWLENSRSVDPAILQLVFLQRTNEQPQLPPAA